MTKQHFAGFLAALAVTAALTYALDAGSATTPGARANPAVTDEVYTQGRLAAPVPTSPLRHVAV
jgi:hypothetical protein